MRVLVTGAGGFLGKHAVARLTADGHDPIALDRSFDRPNGARRKVEADVGDAVAVAGAIEGCDAVLHLAALLPQRRRPASEMQRVNVGGTATVIGAARSAGARRFVFCSSAEVYGVPARVPMPESGPLAPNGEYGRNKVAAEELVRASGLDWVILRPPTIVGPGMPEPMLTEMLRLARRDRPLLVPGGGTRFQMIDVRDLLDALAAALTRDAAVAGVFNVGAAETPTGREVTVALRDALGSRSRLLPVPKLVARPVLALLARTRWRVLEPEHVEIAFADYVLDIGRARDVLGWQPRYSIVEAFLHTLE